MDTYTCCWIEPDRTKSYIRLRMPSSDSSDFHAVRDKISIHIQEIMRILAQRWIVSQGMSYDYWRISIIEIECPSGY